MEDLTPLHLFSLEEYSSAQEFPYLCALQFRLISEGFFTCIASPDKQGKTRVEFITLTSLRKNEETTNTVILITDRVGERDLGMVMVLCHPDQARIEAYDALSIFCQCDSSELSMVVVRRYSNTPYILRGMSHSLYLDVGTFSEGVASAQFPLDRLHLCWLLPFSKSEVLLPYEVEEERLETYPHLPEFLWDSLDEEHHLSNPISHSVPPLAPLLPLEECTQTEEELHSHPASIQTEGLGYHSSLKLLWEANQARAQLEYELIQETQELAERCEHK